MDVGSTTLHLLPALVDLPPPTPFTGADGDTWVLEDGMRLRPHTGGAELRVVSPEVIPLDDTGRRFRM